MHAKVACHLMPWITETVNKGRVMEFFVFQLKWTRDYILGGSKRQASLLSSWGAMAGDKKNSDLEHYSLKHAKLDGLLG